MNSTIGQQDMITLRCHCCQAEKSQNLVEMFDSVGETCPVPMGCGFEGEEHIKLVHTPVL